MGGGLSSSRNTLYNSAVSSVDTNMSAIIDASANIECKNIQRISNTQGCTITFAPQTCTASATSLVTTNASLDAGVTQAVFNDFKQKAESSNEGLIIGLQVSSASNLTYNMTNLSTNITQSFKTDCTKNVSSVNAQIIEDSSCTEKNEIQFATQNISVEIFGECVATQIGTSIANQNIANVMDQAATASNKGVDLWAFLGIFIIFLAFILVIPIGLRILLSGKKKYTPPENKVANFMLIVIFLMFIVWNILMGWFLGFGLFPYRPIQKNSDGEFIAVCRQGESVDPDIAINSFMWWDGDCISYPEGESCNDNRRQKHYQTCGLFADGGCDDPEFLADKDRFIQMNKACSALNTESRPLYCRNPDIAVAYFAQSYGGCIRCTEPDGPNAALYGSFINDSDIDPNNPLSGKMTCDVTKINPLAYQASNGLPCEAGSELGHCWDTFADLIDPTKGNSPYDCPNSAYQARKKGYSKSIRSCEVILDNTIVPPPTDGSPTPLVEMCPPNIFEYFDKCSPGTRECTYTSQDTDPYVVRSCANDLTDCQDPDYLTDFNKWQEWDDKCARSWAQWESLNPAATIYSIVFYVVVIIIVIILFFVGGKKVINSNGDYVEKNNSTFKKDQEKSQG